MITIHVPRRRVRVYQHYREKNNGAPKGVGVLGNEGVPCLVPTCGARGGGFIVVWDWEAGEIVPRVSAEAINVRLVSFPRHLS